MRRQCRRQAHLRTRWLRLKIDRIRRIVIAIEYGEVDRHRIDADVGIGLRIPFFERIGQTL